MRYSPDHPAVRAWKKNRTCEFCDSKKIPVVRKHNSCVDCYPLTIHERRNLVRMRIGKPPAKLNLKFEVYTGIGFFVTGCFMWDADAIVGALFMLLGAGCWAEAVSRWCKNEGL